MSTEIDTYGKELRQAASQLKRSGFSVDIRGDDAARFDFAKSGSKTVEMSRDGDIIFMEFWGGDDESPPFREESQDSFERAVVRAKEWLSEQTGRLHNH